MFWPIETSYSGGSGLTWASALSPDRSTAEAGICLGLVLDPPADIGSRVSLLEEATLSLES